MEKLEELKKENEELKAKLARCEEKNKVCCEENATLFLNQKKTRLRKYQKPRVFTSFVIADCPPMPEINTEGAVRRFHVVAGDVEAVLKQNEEIRADNEKIKELGWKMLAEKKETEAKCDERCRHYDYLLDRECVLVDGLATIQRYFRNGTIYNEDKKREVEEILTRLEFDPTDDEEEEEPVFLARAPHSPEINTEGVRRFHVVAGGAEAVCADKAE
jgi:hypothetical protein